MMGSKRIRYVIADRFPTYRADVRTLFGVELPRRGITSDLVAQCSPGAKPDDADWPSGRMILYHSTGNRFRDQVSGFLHDCRSILNASNANCDAIQVRDKTFAGLVGLLHAWLANLPFFYWISFPMSEGSIELAKREGFRLGFFRWAFVSFKGQVGAFLMYRFLLPRCDHVFVQSDYMARELASRGVARDRMTAVPMGVDVSLVGAVEEAEAPLACKLKGRRVLGYLGVLDRSRQIDFLFEVLAAVRNEVPNACLLLVGDTYEDSDRDWLKSRAADLGVEDAIVWVGWVATKLGWQYIRLSEVALSAIPRGKLFDGSSPTKVVEYMALGVPIVANDQPDQHQVLTESGAGLSVAMNIKDFADAILRILNDSSLRAAMSSAGPPYIEAKRSYEVIGNMVADVYNGLFDKVSGR